MEMGRRKRVGYIISSSSEGWAKGMGHKSTRDPVHPPAAHYHKAHHCQPTCLTVQADHTPKRGPKRGPLSVDLVTLMPHSQMTTPPFGFRTVLFILLPCVPVNALIDRRAVVVRHALRTAIADASLLDPLDVFTIGNGDFALNVDATGLQTFNSTYATAMPSRLDLNTLSSWGWHSLPYHFPNTTDPAAYLRAMNWSYLPTPVSATENRTVPYLVGANDTETYGGWTDSNPHRMGLGQLSLRLVEPGAAAGDDPAPPAATALINLTSELDTWAGGVASAFTLRPPAIAPHFGAEGPAPGDAAFAITVETAVHPDVDLVATRLNCSRKAGASGCPVALRLALPYSMMTWSPSASAWCCDNAHTTAVVAQGAVSVSLALTLDDAALTIDCTWDDAAWTWARTGPHAFALTPPPGAAATAVQLSCLWAPAGLLYPIGLTSSPFVQAKAAATRKLRAAVAGGSMLPFYDAVHAAGAAMLADFWMGGSFVELAAHGAPDALELERRTVLSRYLTRVNSAGASPPQETGLISNSWAGKFHLEMRFWHHAHWPVWGNPELMARSWGFYTDLLPNATSLAAHQGYAGARWLKMLGLANPLLDGVGGARAIDVGWIGHDAPPPGVSGSLLLWDTSNNINPVLVWQQPHVIWMANAQRLAVNASSGAAAALAVMDELAPLVTATADFMASFAFFNASSGFYELGGPILGGEEFNAAPLFYAARKPVFETVYFAAMLDVANEWLTLRGLPRNTHYDAVAAGLGGLMLDPAEDPPAYSFNSNAACCYKNRSTCLPGRFGNRTACSMQNGHPMPAGILGWVDGRRFGEKYGVDAAVANATLRAIVERWAWASGAGWGWDMPLVAMGQVRQGWAPEAVAAMLLMNVTKNEYIRVGYNNFGTFLYLPGNGGTLLTIGMMAAGTSTSPRCNFPAAWGAQCEGFAAAFQ